MAARAIFKAVLRIGDEAVPVKLYSAVQDRSVHFHLLHDVDGVRLEQRMVDPVEGRTVPYSEAIRGYPTDDGFVILRAEELQSIEPEPSRDIEVRRFVPPDRINHQWYDRPYLLGPDGDATAYRALVRALAAEKLEGVARWTMRTKRYVGALSTDGANLRLVTLRRAEEVVPASALPAPGGRALDRRELQMARQLVDMLAGPFEPQAFRDEYRERVLELVRAKARGGTVPLRKAERRRQEGRLADVLAASLESARQGRASA